LVEHPEVEVVLGGKSRESRTARVATPTERDRPWPIITAEYRNSAGYQKKTAREILVVSLGVVAGGGEVRGVGVASGRDAGLVLPKHPTRLVGQHLTEGLQGGDTRDVSSFTKRHHILRQNAVVRADHS